MFISFRRKHISPDPTVYQMVDSDFIIEKSFGYPPETIDIVLYILEIYEKKQLPVATNLALHYADIKKRYQYKTGYIAQRIFNDMTQIGLVYPHIGYKKKYYSCLINQISKLEWMGKF